MRQSCKKWWVKYFLHLPYIHIWCKCKVVQKIRIWLQIISKHEIIIRFPDSNYPYLRRSATYVELIFDLLSFGINLLLLIPSRIRNCKISIRNCQYNAGIGNILKYNLWSCISQTFDLSAFIKNTINILQHMTLKIIVEKIANTINVPFINILSSQCEITGSYGIALWSLIFFLIFLDNFVS